MNVTVTTSTNLYMYSSATHAMSDIFTCNIAVMFAQTWHAQTVETGYLSSDTPPAVVTPSRTLETALIFSPPLLLNRATSIPPQIYPLPSTPACTSWAIDTKNMPPSNIIKTTQTASSSFVMPSFSPAQPPFTCSTATVTLFSSISSVSSSLLTDSMVIADPNIKYNNNIFQADRSPPHKTLNLLANLGYGGTKDTKFITFLYLNVGQLKWFSMMKDRFNVDDTVILLLVQSLKKA